MANLPSKGAPWPLAWRSHSDRNSMTVGQPWTRVNRGSARSTEEDLGSAASTEILRSIACRAATHPSRYFVDYGNEGVRRAKMGMNSLPRRQPPLLKGGLSRRKKRLSTVFAWWFGATLALSGSSLPESTKYRSESRPI